MKNTKKEQIEKIINEVADKTPDWSNWDSHSFENALVDEGCYVKSEDVWKALEEVAARVSELYEPKTLS